MFEKLKSDMGESLSETLVAALIGGLALLVLAQMLTVSAKMIKDSQSVMSDYIKNENELNDGSNTEINKNGAVTFNIGTSYDSLTAVDISTKSDTLGVGKGEVAVTFHSINGEDENRGVVSYDKK